MIVSKPALTRFLCCFKSTLETGQNIKNEILASEIDTAYCRYMVDWHVSPRKSLFLKFYIHFRKPLLGNLFAVDRIFFGGLDDFKRYLVLSIMKIENCWKLKLLKFLQVLLTVSVTIFSDMISRFAAYCFNQHCEQCKVSSSEKSKNCNLKKSIDFRVRTKW